MAAETPPEPDITELGFRVSRLRVSLRIKRGEVRQLLVPEVPEIPPTSISTSPPQPLRLASPAECTSPVVPEQQRHFRSRLSSTSSVDSGIVIGSRSRANSSASSASSTRSGNILRKIARAAIPVGTENAGFEFEGFYHTSVSRTSSTASSARSSVSRTPSTISSTPSTTSSTPSTSSSSPSKFPATNPRVRSTSLSSSQGPRSRVCSDDSSDYADLYDTIEEMTDPFDEEEEDDTAAPPPLPPRKARLRAPALPPYPSTALKMVNDITSTILC